MSQEYKCECGEVLYRIGLLDEAGKKWGLLAEDIERFEKLLNRDKNSDSQYLKCPKCGRKHWISYEHLPPGQGGLMKIYKVTE